MNRCKIPSESNAALDPIGKKNLDYLTREAMGLRSRIHEAKVSNDDSLEPTCTNTKSKPQDST